MKRWGTFDGRVVTLEEMEHQHMSNIYWFITEIVPELYNNTTRVEILNWLNKRFNGLILFYKPHPDFKEERNLLFRKGYLKENGMIVINEIVIGYYDEKIIPNGAHSLEVFAIKDSEYSPTGKEAYIGYKLRNNDFHFISVPYTENKKYEKQ